MSSEMDCPHCKVRLLEWVVISEGDTEYPFGTHYLECPKCGYEHQFQRITKADIDRLNAVHNHTSEERKLVVLCDCQDPEKDVSIDGGCMTQCEQTGEIDYVCPVCHREIRVYEIAKPREK
jgi:DNA-directed RNA polymerase subunit M/transcription elongation factor TFIIS